MLPDSYRWHDGPEGSRLFYNYGCVAMVRPGKVTISRGKKKAPLPPLEGVCGSVEHGKRHVEAYLLVRMGKGRSRALRRP